MTASLAPFDESVLAHDPARRRPVLRLLHAALLSVDPERAVERTLRADPPDEASVRVLAVGKAAPAMARAAERALPGRDLSGVIVSDHEEAVPGAMNLITAGHPVPDVRSLEGARASLALLGAARETDLVLCLLSGGGSAMLEMPAAGLTLQDLQETSSALLASGAPIHDMNTVRKHLSAVKGGRLAQAAAPARLLTLILSDVVGNPLDVIASGPTVPDSSSYEDALAVLDRFALRRRLPETVIRHLEAGAAGKIDETLKTPYRRQTIEIISDGGTAAAGAAAAAAAEGLPVRIATTALAGEARSEAIRCLRAAGVGVTLFAGECTVTVTGPGRGGRNQEAALAAAIELDGDSSTVFAAFGTDGIDGPTRAAGAVVDGSTLGRGRASGLDAAEHLARNDANPFLAATGDLLLTGPTGTNVGDLWVVVRD